MNNAVHMHDVVVRYGGHVAVHDLHAGFERGSLTAVAGPNGSGKSTMLKVIAGIIRPTAGHVHMAPDIAQRIAYLPQSAQVALDFPMPVLQVVCSGFWREAGGLAAITPAMRARAMSALSEVGMEAFADRHIGALSGGQFQRVLFARTIVEDAQLILLDEPFAAVDADTTARLIKIIMDWHAQGRTVICVLHDLMLIRKYFPESVVLAGKCLGRGHTHDLFRQKLLSFDLDMAALYPDGEPHSPAQDYAHGHDCKDHA